MAYHVTLKNIRTGALKRIKVGFSWTCFLFSGLLGIPLFLRGLYLYGFIMVLLVAVNSSLMTQHADQGAQASIQLTFLILAVWFGFKANKLTAKRLLSKGWVFSTPESDETKLAKAKWGIA